MRNSPQRIVSLAPSNTEILFSLGLDAEVVGVTDYCDYPPQVEKKGRVGSFLYPDIEKIESLKPDFILGCEPAHSDLTKKLKKRGYAVGLLDSKTVADVLEDIDEVGKLTGKTKQAEELVFQLRERG